MGNIHKNNNRDQDPKVNYRGNGVQTPTITKTVQMPTIKPAKTQTTKK